MPKLRPLPVKSAEEEIELSLPPEGEIEIELPGDDDGHTEVDVSPKPEVKPVAKEAPKEADDNPLQKALEAQQRAEELQRTAQRERDEAQRQIRERDEELHKERGDRQEAEFNSVLTAIAAEESALAKFENDYAAYASAGDWANAGKAQRAMATAASRLDRLEDSKQAFEKRDKTVTTETKTPPVAKPQDFEQRISQFPDRAKTWLRSHPEFISDDSLNRKINAAHQYLTETKGVQAFSPAYFDALDGEFGFKAERQEPEPKPQQRTRSIPMTAPVSRETVSPSGQRQSSTKITLTEEERLIARGAFVDRPDMPKMTDAQKEFIYAQNKQKLQKMRASGEYRVTSEQNG
jgi:hypothetical protein